MKFSSLAIAVLAVLAAAPLADSFAYVPPVHTPVNMEVIQIVSAGPSITISSASTQTQSPAAFNIDKAILKLLEEETRAAEKEAKVDERKARVEKSREAFFDYDAKMAAQQEARIENAEQKALVEANKDKEEVQKLKVLEQKAEEEVALANTKQEKATKQKEANVSCFSMT
jgi:uncharacterized membrane protein YqiK